MDNSIASKCQWLEKRCTEYRKNNEKLHKRLQRLEKLSSERDIPYRMYNNEREYANCLIRNALQGNSKAYQSFIKFPSPSSYKELYYQDFPELKKYFVLFVRTIKNYLDFLEKCTYIGPIFTAVINETNDLLQDKLTRVKEKLQHYHSLLQLGGWSVNLDETTKNVRTEILRWVISGNSILSDITAYLEPRKLNHVSAEMDDADFLIF